MSHAPVNPSTTPPPTPRRCRRILQAHHLDCQGRSVAQIAEQLGCARSTAYAYLRDFQLHRAHILHTVAADSLLDQVFRLTEPQTDPQQHRQTVAATRELRLLLTAMPGLQEHERQQQQQLETARNAAAVALARQRHYSVSQDGHLRGIGQAEFGECMPECPTCRPDLYEGDHPLPPIRTLSDWAAADLQIEQRTANPQLSPAQVDAPDSSPSPCKAEVPNACPGLDPGAEGVPPRTPDESNPSQPALSRPQPDQTSDTPPESGQIWTNPDIPEQQQDESPVHDNEFAPTPPNSRPRPHNIGPDYPASWDNPFGYPPPPPRGDSLVPQLFANRWLNRRNYR